VRVTREAPKCVRCWHHRPDVAPMPTTRSCGGAASRTSPPASIRRFAVGWPRAPCTNRSRSPSWARRPYDGSTPHTESAMSDYADRGFPGCASHPGLYDRQSAVLTDSPGAGGVADHRQKPELTRPWSSTLDAAAPITCTASGPCPGDVDYSAAGRHQALLTSQAVLLPDARPASPRTQAAGIEPVATAVLGALHPRRGASPPCPLCHWNPVKHAWCRGGRLALVEPASMDRAGVYPPIGSRRGPRGQVRIMGARWPSHVNMAHMVIEAERVITH